MTPAVIVKELPTREYILSITSGDFKKAIEAIPEDIVKLSPEDLEQSRKPSETDFYLRKRLWELIEKCQKGEITEISQASIYAGLCTSQNWTHRVLNNPIRLSYLITHPMDEIDRMRAGLSIALNNLLKFVSEMPNEKTAGAFVKSVSLLLDRVHGPVVQKMEAKHAHLNLNKPIADQSKATSIERLEELRGKLIEHTEIEVTEVSTNSSGN